MAKWNPKADEFITSGSLTLIVGWRKGKKLEARRVSIHKDVANELRKAATRTVTEIVARTPRDFAPEGQLEEDQCFVVLKGEVDVDAQFRSVVSKSSTLKLLNSSDVGGRAFLFYGVVIGDDLDGRTAFVRLWNLQRGAKSGRFWSIFSDTLTKIEDPVFLFDTQFDVVLAEDGIAVLRQGTFETLFRDVALIYKDLPKYVQSLDSALPLAEDGAARLLARCTTNSRLAKKIRAIAERGHMNTVTISMVRKEIKRQKLDETKLIRKGKLVFDDVDPYTLLKLINEDLFVGGLTETPFEADRKSVR